MAAANNVGLELSLDAPGTQMTRLRGAATVVLDVTKADPGIADAGLYVLRVNVAHEFALQPGINTIEFDFDVAPLSAPFHVAFGIVENDATNVADAWASIDVTQCDVLAQPVGTVATGPLAMTPIQVQGVHNAGGGGFHIPQAGALSAVAAVAIVGYYANATDAPEGAAELYAPRWLAADDYVVVDPPVALPVFDANSGIEGSWGWWSSDPLYGTLPADTISVCKVTLDGGTPVLAILPNLAGY